jgi:hypothetical protein
MGNCLHVVYKNKSIANIGRKYNYIIDPMGDSVPESYDEVMGKVDEIRDYVKSKIIALTSVLATLDKNNEDNVYLITQISDEISGLLEYLEEGATKAGKIMTLLEMTDEYNDGIEILDDFELEKKEREK